MFCRKLLKNEKIPIEKKQKEDKTTICVETQDLSKQNELCRSQLIYVAAKTSQNSRMKRAFWVATIKFSIATELEEDFEESCRNILKINAEGTVLRHYFFMSQHKR